jgi:hypothetical protein
MRRTIAAPRTSKRQLEHPVRSVPKKEKTLDVNRALEQRALFVEVPTPQPPIYRTSTYQLVQANHNPSIVRPAAVQDGDYMLLFYQTNDSTLTTAPAGWTMLVDGLSVGTSGAHTVWVFGKTAASSDTSFSVASSGSNGYGAFTLLAYSNATAVADVESTKVQGTNPQLPATTAPVASLLVGYVF